MEGSKVGPRSEVPLLQYTRRKRRQPVRTLIPALIVAASIVGHAVVTLNLSRYELECTATVCVRLDRMTGAILRVPQYGGLQDP